MMFGFLQQTKPRIHALSIALAHKLARQLTKIRKDWNTALLKTGREKLRLP